MKRKHIFWRVVCLIWIAAFGTLSVLPGTGAKYVSDWYAFNWGSGDGIDVVYSNLWLFGRVQSNNPSNWNDLKYTFTPPAAGYYAFVLRGGDGGSGQQSTSTNLGNLGGRGGIVYGTVYLATTDLLYIYVGAGGYGKSADNKASVALNGGRANNRGGGGGGLTMLSKTNYTSQPALTEANLNALWANVLGIAAGGGGGGGGYYGSHTDDTAANVRYGGDGGAVDGGNGSGAGSVFNGQRGRGATAGAGGTGNVADASGDGSTGSSSWLGAWNGWDWGGGGGAGYCGGGGGDNNNEGEGLNGGGGGGSSFLNASVNALPATLLSSSALSPYVSQKFVKLNANRYSNTAADNLVGDLNVANNTQYDGDCGYCVLLYLGTQNPSTAPAYY